MNTKSKRKGQGALWLVCLLTACAHASAPGQSSPPVTPPPARASAPAAPAALEPPDEHDPESAEGEAELEPPPRIEDYMQGHFVIATWSRDAVINGNLEALREPLMTLAEFDYGPVVPGAWMSQIAALQATARLTAAAKSLGAAAVGVATMARQCGDCHTAERHKPYFGPDIRTAQPPPPDSLRERMERHIWAADRMWEGLTAPSDDAWNAGASVLAAVSLESPWSDTPLREDFKARLRALRQVGSDALAADSRARRADVYGTLLSSCAHCHVHEDKLEF